jgi:hypothetical protein
MGIMKRVTVSKREIVVVAVMLVAVLYGVHELFVAASSKWRDTGGRERTAQVDTLIREASEILKTGTAVPVYAAIVSGAGAEWKRDPFHAEITPAARAANLGPLAYTGYVEIGSKRIAVINGMSYEAGDELELGGYVVKRIRSSAVVISEKGTGKSVTIPLVDE